MTGAHPDEWKCFAEHNGSFHASVNKDGIVLISVYAEIEGRAHAKIIDGSSGNIEQAIAMVVRGLYLAVNNMV